MNRSGDEFLTLLFCSVSSLQGTLVYLSRALSYIPFHSGCSRYVLGNSSSGFAVEAFLGVMRAMLFWVVEAEGIYEEERRIL